MPGYLSPQDQRELIKASLDNARSPNENNLDTHYNVPAEGLWAAWKTFNHERIYNPGSVEPIVETKTPTDSVMQTESKRTLIENKPASVENFEDMQAMAKLPAPPSSTLTPLPLSSILPRLRWSNIGHFYHWGTKSYQFDREHIPIPSDIKSVCQRAVRAIPWNHVWSNAADISAGEWELASPDFDQWHETYRQW